MFNALLGPFPTKTCSKCGVGLDYPAMDSLAYCDECRALLRLPGVRPVFVDYDARQKSEKIPYVLPVEKWPELRREIPRGPSRYDSTIKYFQDMEEKYRPSFMDVVYRRSAA